MNFARRHACFPHATAQRRRRGDERDTENASINYCVAAPGAEKADNYADRRQFCQTKQMLSQGSSGIGGEMNNHKFSYEKCRTTIDAPHILKPKVVLAPETMTCRADHESLQDFCGMKKSGCVAVEKPTKICMNVVEQFIGNYVIGAGDGPCGVIDNYSAEQLLRWRRGRLRSTTACAPRCRTR